MNIFYIGTRQYGHIGSPFPISVAQSSQIPPCLQGCKRILGSLIAHIVQNFSFSTVKLFSIFFSFSFSFDYLKYVSLTFFIFIPIFLLYTTWVMDYVLPELTILTTIGMYFMNQYMLKSVKIPEIIVHIKATTNSLSGKESPIFGFMKFI